MLRGPLKFLERVKGGGRGGGGSCGKIMTSQGVHRNLFLLIQHFNYKKINCKFPAHNLNAKSLYQI